MKPLRISLAVLALLLMPNMSSAAPAPPNDEAPMASLVAETPTASADATIAAVDIPIDYVSVELSPGPMDVALSGDRSPDPSRAVRVVSDCESNVSRSNRTLKRPHGTSRALRACHARTARMDSHRLIRRGD